MDKRAKSNSEREKGKIEGTYEVVNRAEKNKENSVVLLARQRRAKKH